MTNPHLIIGLDGGDLEFFGDEVEKVVESLTLKQPVHGGFLIVFRTPNGVETKKYWIKEDRIVYWCINPEERMEKRYEEPPLG